MKSKILILSVVFALAISAVSPALAQTSTTTPSTVTQISELLAKVKQLQDQLEALQQQQKDVSTELRETVQLTRSLYRGLTGDDVKTLQEILATDPEIYPEGIVSGFFGPLTEQAVRRFQARFGIAALGIAGPQTLAKIHALLEGDSIRQGLLKKAENLTDKSNPAGKCRAELAAGPAEFVAKYGSNINKANAFGMCVRTMAQQMGDDDDEDEDEEENEDEDEDEDDEDEDDEEDELEITDVDADDITDTTATITWMTNASSTSKVYYSTEEGFDIDDDGVESEDDSDEVMEHSIDLSDLEPDTTYYFVVVSENDDDEEMSSEESFTTDEEVEE